MKKLITILFLFSFSLQAQIQLSENYSFKPDKGLHAIGGAATSLTLFSVVYHKTNDPNLAFRAGWMSSAFVAMGKEGFDFMSGKEISLADMTYTIASGILTSFIYKKIVTRKKETIQDQLIKEDPIFALDNEIFIK